MVICNIVFFWISEVIIGKPLLQGQLKEKEWFLFIIKAIINRYELTTFI